MRLIVCFGVVSLLLSHQPTLRAALVVIMQYRHLLNDSLAMHVEEEGKIVVRRAARFTSEDIRRALFPDGPPKRKSLSELKEGIRQYIREKHARR